MVSQKVRNSSLRVIYYFLRIGLSSSLRLKLEYIYTNCVMQCAGLIIDQEERKLLGSERRMGKELHEYKEKIIC